MVTLLHEVEPQLSCSTILIQVAKQYLDSLNLNNSPKIYFVSLLDIKEAKVNDAFDNADGLYLNLNFFVGMPNIYAQLVVIHEIFHYVKQGLLDSHCVSNLRDNHLWNLMQLSDVEADVETAIYLNECGTIRSFDHYLEILYQGAKTFRDKKMRIVKLERSIGSMLSVKQAFESGNKIIYLPFLSCDTILLSSINYCGHNLNFQWLPLQQDELSQWKTIFQDAALLNKAAYIALANQLTVNIFNTIQR